MSAVTNKFPKKIIKFRFSIDDIENKRKISNLLSIILEKYPPELYYIKQLDDIRMIIDDVVTEDIFYMAEQNSYCKTDLFEAFEALFDYWVNIPRDLKCYILISFNIELETLKRHLPPVK